MAEEKTILTVDLYNNVLTEKAGDYTGKIHITGTMRTPDIHPWEQRCSHTPY